MLFRHGRRREAPLAGAVLNGGVSARVWALGWLMKPMTLCGVYTVLLRVLLDSSRPGTRVSPPVLVSGLSIGIPAFRSLNPKP